MLKRFRHPYYFWIISLLVALLVPVDGVKAQSVSASELINTVNALRASRGLAAYQVDSGLMTYSQQHADYIASIQTATHTHSDGSIPWENGIQENVASGTDGIITAAIVVNQIWSDYIHMKVMVDYASGNVGAGVALGGDGNIYFVLNVVPGEEAFVSNQTNSTESVNPTTEFTATTGSAWIVPLVKSTPNAEGEVLHIVQNGQSLWDIAIAYEVKIDDIRVLNFIPTDSTVINVGQELLIMRVTVQPTVEEMTVTPSPSETSFAPTSTPTIEIMAAKAASDGEGEISAPTALADEPEKENQFNFAYLVITIILIVLLFYSYFRFIVTKEKPTEKTEEMKE